jgi:hypothetical protein
MKRILISRAVAHHTMMATAAGDVRLVRIPANGP